MDNSRYYANAIAIKDYRSNATFAQTAKLSESDPQLDSLIGDAALP